MEPDTAFWILSSIAQSSAALAGLSALLLVFAITAAQRDIDLPFEVGIYEVLRSVPFFRILATGTVLYLAAVIISLGAIGAVTAVVAPVAMEVIVATYLSMALLGAGSFALVLFVLTPRKWFESPETRKARREARKRRQG